VTCIDPETSTPSAGDGYRLRAEGLFAFGALGGVQAQVEVSSSWNEATQRNNDPANPNTKGGGLSDHDELNAGTDPLDPVSN